MASDFARNGSEGLQGSGNTDKKIVVLLVLLLHTVMLQQRVRIEKKILVFMIFLLFFRELNLKVTYKKMQ